jgi:hypothetical protein
MRRLKGGIFGYGCRVTLATTSVTWDTEFKGPGVIFVKGGFLEVHTEDGNDASYDMKAVVGWQSLNPGMMRKEEDDAAE